MSILSKLAKKKFLGVSLGGIAGGATQLPGANIVGSKAAGVDPRQDLTAGARNAAALVPLAATLGQGGVTGTPSGTPSAASTGPAAGTTGGIPQALSSFFGSAGGLSGLADKGLSIAQLINAANLQKQSTEYAKSALNTANESYGARSPLRVAGIEGMLHPQTADLSSLSQIPGNPFAPKRPVAPIPVNVPPVNTYA